MTSSATPQVVTAFKIVVHGSEKNDTTNQVEVKLANDGSGDLQPGTLHANLIERDGSKTQITFDNPDLIPAKCMTSLWADVSDFRPMEFNTYKENNSQVEYSINQRLRRKLGFLWWAIS